MRHLPRYLLLGLLVLTGALFAQLQIRQKTARDAAAAAMPLVLSAVDARLTATLEEGRRALADWEPGRPYPAPLAAAELSTGGRPSAEMSATSHPGVRAGLTRRSIVVTVDRDDGFKRGQVALTTFGDTLRADSRVGEPAAPIPDKDEAAHYSRIELLSGTGELLWSMGTVYEAEDGLLGEESQQYVPGAGQHTPKPHREIARGRPAPAQTLGYKDADGRRVLGIWRPMDGFPGVWAVAEIREEAVIAPVAGHRLAVWEFEVGHVHSWHASLALTVLMLVVWAFQGLQTRELRYSLLLRVFDFVRPYAWGVAGVVVLGLVNMLANLAVKVFLLKTLMDDVLVKQPPDAEARIIQIGIAVVALAFLLAGTAFLRTYLHNYYATAINADIRLAIGKKIVSLPLSFFHRMRAGDLVSRIERDAASMRKVFGQVFKTAAIEPFELVGMVVAAFVVNPRLALVLLGLPIVVVPLFRIARKIKKRAKKRQVLLAELSHVIFQMLVGIKVVKAFGGENREAQRLDEANRRFIHQARRIHRLSAFSGGLLDFIQMVGAAGVMVAGGMFVLSGGVTVGEITVFIVMMQRCYKAAKNLTATANGIVNAQPGVARVFEVLDAENTLPDGPKEMAPGPLREGIRFHGVDFAYEKKQVLEGIDLEIPAGKIVALVGPTGAGKTTLCDLVARFYDVTKGSVLYDGVDVREYSVRSLLANVAVVTQDAFLFNAPVDENIEYGRPGATREEIRKAARDAFVHEEIEAMEGGYKKLAGERGTSLSGGQRQRVTIARAILKDAPVLILDEATSALDTHAEQQVQAALDKLMSGRTVIVVAHRLSTIRNADKVVVVERGRIVEQGAPAELLALEGGRFRAMYERQMGTAGDDPDDA